MPSAARRLARFVAGLGFKDKDGYYFTLRATVNVIAYNTKLVSAAEAPGTWKDLLDPKWKGKLVTAHPG
jgi:iron(III) transport system substrate-binding protein